MKELRGRVTNYKARAVIYLVKVLQTVAIDALKGLFDLAWSSSWGRAYDQVHLHGQGGIGMRD
jgi:hypothetical protein